MSPVSNIVLFDPFETLGSEIAASREHRFVDFDVYPSAREVLRRLSERARIGVLSLDPDVPHERLVRLLSAKQLIPPIDRALVAVAGRDDARPFGRLLASIGLTGDDRVVFVSLDAGRRTRAHNAGLRTAPHAALASAVLAGESLHYVRLFARSAAEPEWASFVHRLPAVPLLRVRDPEPALYAIVSRRAYDALSQAPLSDTLGFEELAGSDAVARTTLVLLQLTAEQVGADGDLQHFVSGLAESGLPVMRQTPRGILIGFPADRPIEALHPPPAGAGHGHTVVLLPDPSLLKAPARRVEFVPRALGAAERRQLATLDGDAFRRELETWFGSIGPS